MLQPFTNEKPKLIAAVANGFGVSASSATNELGSNAADIAQAQDTIRRSGSSGGTEANPNARSADDVSGQRAAIAASRALAQFVKIRAQLSVQQSRPVIAAIAAICEAQRGIPGKKVVVLFSQGFVTSSTQDWQVQAMIDLANRANVSVYIVDSGGLVAEAPRGGGPVPRAPLESVSGITSQESRMRASGGENVFDNVRHEGLNREQEILYRISGDTGGQFIKNMNDISKGLDLVDQEIRSRYTLGYYTTNQNFDGAFRKVKVTVRRPGAEVSARDGYYAIGEGEIVPLSPDDKKLMAGFDAAAANPALPLFADLSPFRSREGRYVVPLSLEIPPSALKVDRKGGKRHMQLEVLGVVRDAPTEILSRLGGTFNIELDDEQFEAVVNNNVFFRQDVELDPGEYTFELIVRDKLSGKTAAKRERLVLPEAGAELTTSGVVLSRIATPAVAQPGALDVLSAGGAQIRPSPAREFRPADKLIIFFDVYNAAAAAGKANVRVTVTLMKDGKPAARPTAYQLTDVAPEPAPHLTFAKFLSLDGLAAGSYLASIEARDMATHKVVTRQVPFVISR
jgi:VWFA-related protein